MRLRPRSLFWTFAGAFLAVVALAAVVQAWVLSGLGQRLAEEGARSAAQRPAFEAGLDLAGALADGSDGRVGPILEEHGAPDGSFFLVYRGHDGAIVLPLPATRDVRHRIARWLETGVDAWGIDPRYDAPGRELGGPRSPVGRPPPRRGRRDPRGGPPPRPGPEGRRPAPPRDGAGPPPRMRPSDLPAPGALLVVARVPVRRGAAQIGEVVAVHPRPRAVPWRVDAPSMLLVPVALLLAAAGGLVLFRLLTRRLRRLEALATRVAAGDLGARVADPGDDEIGRLGAELNHMAASLEQARAEIETAAEQRRRLLADVSHELATPLTTIRGYAETLLDSDLPTSGEERREYLDNVLDEARRMELLIGDLFELTRLEAGIGELDRERLDCAALCRHTLDRFAARFAQAELALRGRDAQGPVWIEADGRRMEQVLENLLTNALRYVPEGGEVTVAVSEEGSTAVLEVADDGPGFPPEDLPHVFDRFYRSAATEAVPGSGLGLAIVQEIVQRHGGRVAAENRSSSAGGGAILRIVLPRLCQVSTQTGP